MLRVKKRLLCFLLILLLVSGFIGLYFMPLKINNTVTIWLSNSRFMGFNPYSNMDIFILSNITSRDNAIEWRGKGLIADINISNISFLSLCNGLSIWANDSLSLFKFPMVSENDQFFENQIFLSISDVKVYASKEGTIPISIPYFNRGERSNAYVYVDLDQVESILEIKDNESYRISLSMAINYYLHIPSPPFLSNNPGKIAEEKTVSIGNIDISCSNGKRQYAHVDFPYQEFSYSIQIPYIKQVFPFI